MKNFIKIILSLTIFVGDCYLNLAHSKENFVIKKQNEIHFKVKKHVNGFEIFGTWYPDDKLQEAMSNRFTGPLIVNLRNIKTQKIIQFKEQNVNILQERFYKNLENENIEYDFKSILNYLKKQKIMIIDNMNDDSIYDEKINFSDSVLFIKCNNFKNNCFKISTKPFNFFDLDYDGVKDFIITSYNTGQRGVAKFKVHTMENGPDGNLQYNSIKDRHNDPIFKDIDEMTLFNISMKHIAQVASNGACSSYTKVYAKKNDAFEIIRDVKFDNNGCSVEFDIKKNKSGQIFKKYIIQREY
jgi:hypothetical protein